MYRETQNEFQLQWAVLLAKKSFQPAEPSRRKSATPTVESVTCEGSLGAATLRVFKITAVAPTAVRNSSPKEHTT